MVFRSGRGGGQDFPAQDNPAIGHEEVGGGTAGLAQLGIVGFDLRRVEGNALGLVVGAMLAARGNFPWTVLRLCAVGGVGWYAGMGQA